MLINRVTIKNFKQFKQLDMKLDKLNILVGNNDSGKTTIVEAINLALTGYYRGKSIFNNIDESLFNKEVSRDYLNSLSSDRKLPPPKIEIEIYLDDFADFNGNNTREGESADGFKFSIFFDDEHYKKSYEDLIENNDLDSIPIEYYTYSWSTFSRTDRLRPREIPIKSIIIDSDTYQSHSIFTSRIINTFFDDDDRVKMTQEYRRSNEKLSGLSVIKKVNEKINTNEVLHDKNVAINVNKVSMTSWENNLSLDVLEIPFQDIGKGTQNIVKTHLTFESDILKNKSVILIEEPENHLSFSNLNKLLKHLKDSLKEYQVIITTHNSFVANKLGLDNLHMLANQKHTKLNNLNPSTIDFFVKKAGYDTLRFLLCDRSILVEGDSDELLVQKHYLDQNSSLPIEEGIDVISVGLSAKRFLEIAVKLNLKVSVVTDNDGNIEALFKKYSDYVKSPNIKICFEKTLLSHAYFGVELEEINNVNTLEPLLIKYNSLEVFNKIFEKEFAEKKDLLKYMLKNKTDCALKIYNSDIEISYPNYIIEAFND